MNYKALGKTGLEVSEISFGSSGIGGMFEKTEEKEAINTVHQVFDNGINYFDTSPAYGTSKSEYGPVTSELVLGKAIKSLNRSEFILSTKAGKITSLPPEFNFRHNSIINSVESSLKRLNTDYIDILFLHDIEYDRGKHIDMAMNEGLEALSLLKKEGKIKFFGISCYSVKVLKKIIKNYDLDVVLVHNHYNLVNDLLGELMPLIKEKEMGLVSASPFASGLLTAQGPPDWYPIVQEDLDIMHEALGFCKVNNVQIEKLALQYALSNAEIPTTLFSSTNHKTALQNINWVEDNMDAEMIKKILKLLSPLKNKDFDFGDYND